MAYLDDYKLDLGKLALQNVGIMMTIIPHSKEVGVHFQRRGLLAAKAVAIALGLMIAVQAQTFTGRVGSSHDGNQHDRDDIGAAAFEIGIFAKAGARLVHVDFNNHLASSGDGNDASMTADQKTATEGAAQQWYGSTSMTYNCQTNLTGAINNIAAEINKSTATDRFYLLCAGPMEVAWRGINASDPAKRQYCTAISHSSWNDGHTNSTMTHTWSSIQGSGVNAVHISDQNPSLNCFSNSCWDWAKNSADARIRFMYDQMALRGVFGDISDAGMAWYVITGLGDQGCTPAKLQSFFTNGTQPSPNQPPVASFTSPVNGAAFAAPASFSVTVSASDPDGSVSNVKLYKNGTLVRQESSAPYQWNNTNQDGALQNLVAGTYTLRADATDNGGAVTSVSITITVTSGGGNIPPTVSLTSPAGGASFTAPASITLNATAADANGTISKVEFYQGATLLGISTTSPYSYAWTNVAAGSYTLTAKAYDNGGATTTSSAVGITVTSTVTGINAFSQIQAESFSSQLGVQTESCSEGGQDVGFIENGDYLVFNNVNFGTGAASFNARVASATSGGSIEVRLDNLTGALVGICAVTGTGGWQTWATRSCSIAGASGTHNLYVKFTGGSGFLFNANWVQFVAGGSANVLPTVTLTGPANGATFAAPASITLNATAADADGSISKVEFYQGTALLGTSSTSPYSYTWTNVLSGLYSLTAKAYDNAGATVASSVVNVTVTGGTSGTITLQAESFSSQSGIQTESCSEGGQNVGWVENGDYLVFSNVNLGAGASSFSARVASAVSGGSIEIRLDNLTGILVGTCAVAGTGGWQTWVTTSCALAGASGIHTIYLKFVGGSGYLFNINWLSFSGAGLPKFLREPLYSTIDPVFKVLAVNSESVRFSLPQKGNFALSLYDMAGARVAAISQDGDAGANLVSFHRAKTAPGMYAMRLEFDGKSISRHVRLVR